MTWSPQWTVNSSDGCSYHRAEDVQRCQEFPEKTPGIVRYKDQFTGRHRPRRGGAGWQQRPSPCGTPRAGRGRLGPRGEQERGRRRTPAKMVSIDMAVYHRNSSRCIFLFSLFSLRGGTYQSSVADQLASEPQEGLLEVVVRLGGDIVVLQVLLAVEGDGLGLDLALLHVNLVTAQNNGDVLADTDEVTWDEVSLINSEKTQYLVLFH